MTYIKNYRIKLKIILCFVFIAQSSKIFWYDFKELFIFGKIQGSFYLLLYIYALLLLPLSIYYIIKKNHSLRFELSELILLHFLFFYVLLGIIYKNPVNFIISDFYKSFLCIASFFLFKKIDFDNVCNWIGSNIRYLVLYLTTLITGRYIVHYYFFNSRPIGLVFGTAQDLLLPGILFFLILDALKRKQLCNLFFSLFFLSISLLFILSGQKRTTLIALPCLFLYITYITNKKNFLVQLKAFFFAVLTMIFLATISLHFATIHNFNRIKNTDWEKKLAMNDSRMAEIITVANSFQKSNIFEYMFGKGFGATYKKYNRRIDTIEDRHTVEVTPVAVFFRNGLAGIIIYSIILLKLFRTLIKPVDIKRTQKKKLYGFIIVKTYLLLIFLYSITIYGLIDDPLFFLFLGTSSPSTKR